MRPSGERDAPVGAPAYVRLFTQMLAMIEKEHEGQGFHIRLLRGAVDQMAEEFDFKPADRGDATDG